MLTAARTLTLVLQSAGRKEEVVLSIASEKDFPRVERETANLLRDQELVYYRSLRSAQRQQDYLLGRYVAKSAVARWLDQTDFAALEIRPGAFNQPVPVGPAAGSSAVTLAHSGGLALALAHDVGHPIGIDLETIREDRLETLKSQVTPKELPPRGTAGDQGSARDYTLVWAIKEALSKALRCGLTCPFEVLAPSSVTPQGDGCFRGEFKNFAQYQFLAWSQPDHAFAVVVSKRIELTPHAPAFVRFCRPEGEE